ncbi:MAG: DUF1428 domain-containing protein [Gammaproteobacteria bacterium]|nr:DUF1428 domain-containing protein [Gammaproteobacteria bacterium]
MENVFCTVDSCFLHSTAHQLRKKYHESIRTSTLLEEWGDDVPEGKVTSFSMAVLRKDDEAIVFSWVTWPSKAVRDAGLQKVFEDPGMQGDHSDMPFDGQRMIYGGFVPIVVA